MDIGVHFSIFSKQNIRLGEIKYQKLKQIGFSAVDFDTADTETSLYAPGWEETVRKERILAAQAGISISQIHGPWRYPPRDLIAEDRAERLNKMKHSLRIAQLLGCRHWVVHPIMPHGTHDLETGHEEETWEMNLEFMTKLLAFAKTLDVTICLENMPMRSFSIATPKQILKFVKAMNDDRFRICLDTGHVAVFPGLTAGDTVRELGTFIKVLHVHDNQGDRDAHLWPTEGITDWLDFTAALKETGFKGVFSLETLPPQSLDSDSFCAECARLFRIASDLTKPLF